MFGPLTLRSTLSFPSHSNSPRSHSASSPRVRMVKFVVWRRRPRSQTFGRGSRFQEPLCVIGPRIMLMNISVQETHHPIYIVYHSGSKNHDAI